MIPNLFIWGNWKFVKYFFKFYSHSKKCMRENLTFWRFSRNSVFLDSGIFSRKLEGFFLTVSPLSIMEVARHAKENNKPYCMNLSAPFLSEFFTEPMMEAMPYVDILFGNEQEAVTFSRIQKFGTEIIEEIALKICELPKENKKRSRIAVITQGQDPVIIAQDGEISTYPVMNLRPEEIIDTNGAGDAFVGGFLSQYIRNKSLDVCVKCGIYAATEVIKRSGCTFPKNPNFSED